MSFVFSFALLAALAGNCYAVTGDSRYSLFVAAAAGAGLYVSVWHTTSGAHALGDLCTFLAGLALMRPLMNRIGAVRYVGLVSALCCISACTKVSLWPIAGFGTVMAVLVALRSEKVSRVWLLVIAAAIAPWLCIHLPLLVWTLRASGSPWGPVAAGLFGPTVYAPTILDDLRLTRAFNQTGMVRALTAMVPRFSPLIVLAVPYLALRLRAGGAAYRMLFLVFVAQTGLIIVFLPHDFRFLGGLQFILFFAAAVLLFEEGCVPRLLRYSRVLALLVIVPWVGLQWYKIPSSAAGTALRIMLRTRLCVFLRASAPSAVNLRLTRLPIFTQATKPPEKERVTFRIRPSRVWPEGDHTGFQFIFEQVQVDIEQLTPEYIHEQAGFPRVACHNRNG